MVESKKALPKEPRLSFYSSYTSQYYGGQGQLSPPGGRNYYGPNPYQGMYMNGNRYYQQNSAQVRTYKLQNLLLLFEIQKYPCETSLLLAGLL